MDYLTLPEWRCTFPGRYDWSSAGYDDVTVRQGHYIMAATPREAAQMAADATFGNEWKVDVQLVKLPQNPKFAEQVKRDYPLWQDGEAKRMYL